MSTVVPRLRLSRLMSSRIPMVPSGSSPLVGCAVRRSAQPHDDANECRFSCAVLADKAIDTPRFELEVDRSQNGVRMVAFSDAGKAQCHVRHGVPPMGCVLIGLYRVVEYWVLERDGFSWMFGAGATFGPPHERQKRAHNREKLTLVKRTWVQRGRSGTSCLAR